MNSTISTPFLSQKTVAVSFLADRQRAFKRFRLVWWMCASTALIVLWYQHSQMKFRFHHLLPVWCDREILRHLCGIALKRSTKSEAILCAFCAPVSIFGTNLAQTCDHSLVCDNLVDNKQTKNQTNSVTLFRKRTIPTERPPLVGEVSSNFSDRGCRVVGATNPRGR
jgi:hypothetical protein